MARRFIELLIELRRKPLLRQSSTRLSGQSTSRIQFPISLSSSRIQKREISCKIAGLLSTAAHSVANDVSGRRPSYKTPPKCRAAGCTTRKRPDVTEIGADTRYTARRFLMTTRTDLRAEDVADSLPPSKCAVISVIRPNLSLETLVLPNGTCFAL